MSKYISYKTGIFLAVLALFIFLISLNAFSHIQAILSDKLQGNKKALDNIVIIKIDDKSINEIGKWPWNRDVFAKILLKLKDAKVIGVDLSFFEPSDNDFLLEETLNNMDNVVLAAEIQEKRLYKPIFNASFGYVNFAPDSDGVIRSLKISSEEALPFSFEIYKKSWDKDAEFSRQLYRINFASPGKFSSASASEILKNNSSFKDKIVFLGATAPDLRDMHMVPSSNGLAMPGAEVHANILQNLILDDFIKKQPIFSIILIVLISSFISFFIFSNLKLHYIIPVVLGIIFIYYFLAILIFQKSSYLLDLFFFPLSLLVFTSAGIGINYFEEKKQNAYLTNAFGKYVSKALLEEIISHKHWLNLGGEKKEITVFFSDIRDFTALSEKLAPEELARFMNDYLTEMTKIILGNKGTLDKFIGDAIMAFWNAPLSEKEHAFLACKTSISQIKALKEFNKKLADKKLPLIKIGCGIHTGEAIVGNFGSQDRFDYTALGDTVNIASRLESLTKHYKASIIISESTYSLVKDKPEFKFRKLGIVKLKGKEKPITVYGLYSD